MKTWTGWGGYRVVCLEVLGLHLESLQEPCLSWGRISGVVLHVIGGLAAVGGLVRPFIPSRLQEEKLGPISQS